MLAATIPTSSRRIPSCDSSIAQRRDDHRARADAAACLAIDARIGLAIVAAHRLVARHAQAAQARRRLQPEADMLLRFPPAGAIDHLVVFMQLDGGRVGGG
jgi:hypothetical protein